MKVRLMLTCLCDAFYGEVGIATVKVLEHVGCQVHFDARQTCCGQPPFNAGDWKAAKQVAERCRSLFEGNDPVVTPSASCAAMVREGFKMLGVEPEVPVFELCQFLRNVAHVERWQALPNQRRVAFHRSCHGRMLGLGSTQEDLLRLVGNLEILPLNETEQCCGFGGAFSVTHGNTSKGIGQQKLSQIVASGATEVVGGDMGCLMHLQGLAERLGVPLQFSHVASVLGDAL